MLGIQEAERKGGTAGMEYDVHGPQSYPGRSDELHAFEGNIPKGDVEIRD